MQNVKRFIPQAGLRVLMLFIGMACLVALGATTSYAQGINYPVGSPAATSGTGNARIDADNFFMRNNIAGLTEIPVNEEEETTGELQTSGKGNWRMDGEIQESVYKYRRIRTVPGPTFGLSSGAVIINPGLAGELTYTSGNHKYGLGIGAYQAFGFQSKFIDDPKIFGARSLFFDTKVASNDLAIGGAYRVTKKLSVGAAFIFGRGFLDLKAPAFQALGFGLIRPARLDVAQIGAPGVNVGISYRPFKRLSFGFGYKSKRTYDLKGEFDNFELTGAGIVGTKRKATVEFKIPTVAEAGVAVDVTEKLNFSFDFRFYDYTATLGPTVNVTEVGTKKVLQTLTINAKDVRSIRFGGIYKYNKTTKILFGSAFTTSSFPEASINPGLVNVGGVDVSGGLEKRIKGIWCTFSTAGVFGRPRTVRTPPNLVFPGRYKGNGVLFNVGFRFNPLELLK